MTTIAREAPSRPRPTGPRRVAVMPAYNEAKTIIPVLDRLLPLADELIIVDDGSVDNTRELVQAWSADRPNVRFISFPQNRGMSAAYYRAFEEVGRRVDMGELSADDIILTVDADGQHRPEDVDELIAHMRENRLDAVIARRDMAVYTLYKKIGNFFISMWASLWAGIWLMDVESGYRAFRAGALLTALRYYKGYRYSETVEVAVILARLGYRVDNKDFVVPVPLFRSNTRLKDLVIDIAAMPAAAWRLEARRGAPAGINQSLVYYLPLTVVALLAVMAATVLQRSLFITNDSMQHYSHVWWISDQLFHHASLPLHFKLVDSGDATTFPYGFVPYLTAAALRVPLGDWAVTLLMVTGWLGIVWAAGMARQQLRDPWLALLFVLNPFFIDALYSFQFAAVWATFFFLLFIWAFERGSTAKARVGAVALLWLSVSSHPALGLVATGVYGVYLLWQDRSRFKSYLAVCAMAAPFVAPFVYMTLSTPAAGESSTLTLLGSQGEAVLRRGSVLFFPLLAPYLAGFVRRNYLLVLPIVFAVSLAALAITSGLVRWDDYNRGGYPGVFHAADEAYNGFFASAEFEQGKHYRVLPPTDREEGAYAFIRHGAVLTNGFFSESWLRRDWTEEQFACYAAYKGMDFDVIEAAYSRSYKKNEAGLLEQLVRDKRASVAYSDPEQRFTVYDVRPLVKATPKPGSLDACGL